MANGASGTPLTRLKFYAYKDSEFKQKDSELEFEVQFNPADFGFSFNMEYGDEQPQNATNSPKSFRGAKPSRLAINFVIDGTGAAGAEYKDLDVKSEVDKFFKVVVDYQSDKHRPRYVMLSWGKLIFRGVAESVTVKYNLFTPDGNPLRAKIDVSLSSALSYEKQVAENSPDSPDMTHMRIVRDGDNIPLMSYDIYGMTGEYIKIAKFNRMVNFRRLISGEKINFPPLLDKTQRN